jgi:hypothetical protein
MARIALAIFICAAVSLTSCSQHTAPQQVADIGSHALRRRIPRPGASKYQSIQDARDWENPYLMVQRNGIDARPINAASATSTMSAAEVVSYLEKLPSAAWPYGLVVAV